MDFTKQLKNIAKTELEVVALVAGAVASNQFLADEKIFKEKFATNPTWFTGSREGAPFYIKHSGILKAAVAVYGSTFVKNNWLKLLLFGVAFQGTLQEVRVLTFDKTNNTDRFKAIGNAKELDDKLRALAEKARMSGLGEYQDTSVAAANAGGWKYADTSVADPFSFQDSV